MKTQSIINIARISAALLLLGVSMTASAVRKDDTEVYLDSGAAFAADPIIMFYTEYTSRLAATVCSNIDNSVNTTAALKAALDAQCPDLAPLKEYFVYPDSPGASRVNHDFIGGTRAEIDRYELIRAALKRVLITLGKTKVGLISVHDDDSAGAAGCTGVTATGCSNGAYILHRAVSLRSMTDTSVNDVPVTGTLTLAGIAENAFDPRNPVHIAGVLANDANKAALFRKLNGIPSPQGNFSHKHQDKEVYFELFRYLTGKPVFNGHNGWNDLGTKLIDNGQYNLGQWSSVNNGGRFDCTTPVVGTATENDIVCSVSIAGIDFPTAGGIYVAAPTQGNSYSGDYNGDFISTASGTYISTLPMKWDRQAEVLVNNVSTNVYSSPIDQHCQRIFMINVVYGSGLDADDSNSAINLHFLPGEDAGHGMQMTVENQDAGFVSMVRNLHDYDLANYTATPPPDYEPIISNLSFADKQNVTSFFLADQTSQVNAAADAGGTGAAIQLSSDPTQLISDLNKVLNQILSVSTTFVAASIPVNVFNRSEVIDNAYIALFQADANNKPAWMGDVKKLKLRVRVDTVDGVSTNKLEFYDALGVAAIAGDGRIDSNAITYWTMPDGYDITDPLDVTGADPIIVDNKDGRAVTRGGAGQKIPGFLDGNNRGQGTWRNGVTGARQLFTQQISGDPESASGTKLMNIEWANASRLYPIMFDPVAWPENPTFSSIPMDLTGDYAAEGAWVWPTGCYSYATTLANATTATSTKKNPGTCIVRDIVSNVIGYMRGYNAEIPYDQNATPGTVATRTLTRRWILGDPLHSRPLPINYGLRSNYSTTNPDIRIVVGSNDGYLRMLKNTDTGTTDANNHLGTEVWAFMPREVMKIQKPLMENRPWSSDSTLPRHYYGVDGSPAAYIMDSTGTIGDETSDKVWLFFGLRRGGRGYYALDITNPDAPRFMWSTYRESSTGTGVGTEIHPDFSEIGYTFSQPVIRHINWGTGKKPVLIFGGGYDNDKDIVGQGTDDDIGTAIYIVDAATGSLIWKAARTNPNNTSNTFVNASMVDSIPSEVATIDSNSDGMTDRIYVGDTGGKVWRVDLPNQTGTGTITDPRNTWKATELMNVGRHQYADTGADGTWPNDRRFFSAPDVVPSRDAAGNFDAVVIGSGNREHPLGTLNDDYMYMYKDRCTVGVVPCDGTTSFTPIIPDNLYDVAANTNIDGLGTGWKLALSDAGEKSLSAALTLRGVVYFSTYVPATTLTNSSLSCKPEGTGWFYAVSLADASATFDLDAANGTQADVRRELASGGIPAENVYVSYRDPATGLTYTGILPSDLDATDDLGSQQWRSFWYEKNK